MGSTKGKRRASDNNSDNDKNNDNGNSGNKGNDNEEGNNNNDNNDNNDTKDNPDDIASDWESLSFPVLEFIEHLIKASISFYLEVSEITVNLNSDDLADQFNVERFEELTEDLKEEEALWKFISEENGRNNDKDELGVLIALGAIAEKGACLSMLDNIVRRELSEQPPGDVEVIIQRKGGMGFNIMLGVWIIMEFRKIIAQFSEYRYDSDGAEVNPRTAWEKMVEAGLVERGQPEETFECYMIVMRHLLEFLHILIKFVEKRRLDSEQKVTLEALRKYLFQMSFSSKELQSGPIADAALLVGVYKRGRPPPPIGEGTRPILEERHKQRIEHEVFHLTDPKGSRVGVEKILRSMRVAAAHAHTYRLDITGDEINEPVPDGDMIPLISAPLPEAGENYSKLLYPLKRLEIYDSRNGGSFVTAKLRPSHYIYRMLDYFRCSLLQRANAAKYALMLRAPQKRYSGLEDAGVSVRDFFLNEPGPTAAEIFCVQSWLAKGFPVIHIKDDDGSWGSHDRGTDTRIINLDQTSFNMFEDCIRYDRPTSIIFLTVFCTLAHEFAHYMVSVSYLGKESSEDSVNKSVAYTPNLFRVTRQPNPETGKLAEAGFVLEFLLFGGPLHLLFRGDDISEHLHNINALWFKASGAEMYTGSRLGSLAIVGPELAYHILTTKPVPRLTVQIVRALMQEDPAITPELLEITVEGGAEWDLPLPEAWQIPDVEANFAGREIVDENDRQSIRMYRGGIQGYHGGRWLGMGPALVPLPPPPRWYPKTLSSVPVLAMLAGWAYMCSLPQLNPSATMYKEHWTVVEHYLPSFGDLVLVVMALVWVFWPVRRPLLITGNLSLFFTGVPWRRS